MKTLTKIVLLLTVSCVGHIQAAEHLWTNFDDMPLGSVASQPGWTGFFAARTAQVSIVRSHSPDRSLRFPWNTASPNATAATYADLNVSLGGLTGTVVRLDFHMFLGSTNVPFTVALGERLSFFNQGGVGRVGFNPYNPTPVPLIVNQFVPVTILYDSSRHQYALEYNGQRVVNWSNGETASPVTTFNLAIFLRNGDNAGTTGDMYIDNVRVETYPYDLWAWWRFNWNTNARLVEQSGRFRPESIPLSAAAARGATDGVWDGWHDFHNEGGIRYVLMSRATNTVATPVATSWTLEAVVKIVEDSTQSIFHWGRAGGFESTEAMIQMAYHAGGTLRFILRDAEQTGSNYDVGAVLPFTPSPRWRHIALVKSGTSLLAYLDYVAVASWSLNEYSQGNYQFGVGTHASIGMTLNYAAAFRDTTVIDELRFSGRGLEPYDFLQPREPLIVQKGYDAAANRWNIVFKGILGKAYRIETSPVLGPGANWTTVNSDYVVNSTFSYYENAAGTTPSRFVRIIRK